MSFRTNDHAPIVCQGQPPGLAGSPRSKHGRPRVILATMADEQGVPTLFEWAGGAAAFERLTEVLYRRVAEDAIPAPVFGWGVPGKP